MIFSLQLPARYPRRYPRARYFLSKLPPLLALLATYYLYGGKYGAGRAGSYRERREVGPLRPSG